MASFAARALQLLYSSALGAILQQLFASLCSATKKLVDLGSNLSRLKSTLESIDHTFPDGGPTSFRHEAALSSRRQLIEEGHELIRRGSRVRWWSVFKMWRYTAKIKELYATELQASLDQLYQNDVAASQLLKTERMAEVVINLEEKMNTVIEMASEIATMTRRQIFTSKQVHVGPTSDTFVGLECGAAKAKQLQDKSSFTEIVASGSGWSGKDNTTAESLSR